MRLNQQFRYNPENGVIISKTRFPSDFPDSADPDRSADVYNRLHANKRVLNTWRKKDRNLGGNINGKRLSAARVAWVLGHGGDEPALPTRIKFVNDDPRDLRFSNLKGAQKQNLNSGVPK